MCLWFTGWQLWQCYWWCSALPSLGPEKPKVSAHLWGEGELLWVGEERELPLSVSRLHLLKNCDILFSHHQSLSHGAFIPSTRKGLWMPAFWMLLKVTPYTWDKSSQFSSSKTSLVLTTHSSKDLKRIESQRYPGGGNGNPLQYSCLENSMDRGPWWATVHGITKSWTQKSTHSTYISEKRKLSLKIYRDSRGIRTVSPRKILCLSLTESMMLLSLPNMWECIKGHPSLYLFLSPWTTMFKMPISLPWSFSDKSWR